MSSKSRLRNYIFPISLFLVAFLVRFFYLLELKGDVFFKCLFLDLQYYNDWALRIISGNFIGDQVFEMTPLYAYFLAFIFKFISSELFVLLFLQIIIGSFSCLLIYKITEDLLEDRIYGLISGFVSALYGPFIFFDAMVMKPLLSVFFILLSVFFLLKSRREGVKFPLIAGISLGLCALVRENVILLVPVIPLWLIFLSPRKARRAGVIKAAFFILGITLMILPATLRNLYVAGDLVLITSGGGEVLYIGNNPEADGTYVPPEFVRPTPVYEHEDFRNKARELTGRELTRKESSDFWTRQAINFIRENPGDYILLELKKFLLFWNFYEFPDNKNYYFQKEHSAVLGAPLIHFGIIAPLGFLGLILSIRRYRRFALVQVVFLAYLFSFLLFFNFSRFRIPAVPFIIIFAVYALKWLVENMKSGKAKRAAIPLLSLPVLFFISNYNIIDNDPYSFKYDQSYYIYGKCYAESGKNEKAGEFFKKTLEIDRNNHGALTGLGNIYYQSGNFRLSRNAYRDALKVNPDLDVAHNGLANIYLASGDVDRAISEYKRAISAASSSPTYRTNLGFALMRRGKYNEALEYFKTATEREPGFANAHFGLASAYEGLGLYSDALSEWKRFIELSPDKEWKARARERIDKLRALDRGMR